MIKKLCTVLLMLAVSLSLTAVVWADELPDGVDIQHPEGLTYQEQEKPPEEESEKPEEEAQEPQPVMAAEAAPQTGDSTTWLALSGLGLSLLALTWAGKLKAAQE